MVMQYNTKIQSVPTNIVANMFKFQPEEFFEAPAEEKITPKVSFA
jgi:LemA protein